MIFYLPASALLAARSLAGAIGLAGCCRLQATII
jgi:hypothetical protein